MNGDVCASRHGRLEKFNVRKELLFADKRNKVSYMKFVNKGVRKSS